MIHWSLTKTRGSGIIIYIGHRQIREESTSQIDCNIACPSEAKAAIKDKESLGLINNPHTQYMCTGVMSGKGGVGNYSNNFIPIKRIK